MTSNNALVPDPDKQDILASKPFGWPFLRLGLRMCGWSDTRTKYYLLGTAVIAWGGSLSLLVGLLSFGVYLLRKQRKYIDMEPRELMISILWLSAKWMLLTGEWEHFLYVLWLVPSLR